MIADKELADGFEEPVRIVSDLHLAHPGCRVHDVAQLRPLLEGAGTMIFNEAYQNGYQKDDFAYAILGFIAAKELPNLSESFVHQLNFWHGFSVQGAATLEQEPSTLASARATLPKFQESLLLLAETGEYPASVNVNLAQLVDNIGRYIEIQEAIIGRCERSPSRPECGLDLQSR